MNPVRDPAASIRRPLHRSLRGLGVRRNGSGPTAARSIGDAASVGPGGTVWIVYGSKGGRGIRTEGETRAQAWRRDLKQAEAESGVRHAPISHFRASSPGSTWQHI